MRGVRVVRGGGTYVVVFLGVSVMMRDGEIDGNVSVVVCVFVVV